MIDVTIPEDLFEGTSCLELGIPWQTEGSIHKENENINADDIALEVGTGGSTVFLAKRCKEVIAIETNPDWMKQVSDKLFNDGLENVAYLCIPNEDEICEFIKNMDTSHITVFSVDTQGGYDRSRILNAFIDKGVSDNLRMVIVDNFAHSGLFPLHYDKLIIDSPQWEVFTSLRGNWAGDGTRIYLKRNNG